MPPSTENIRDIAAALFSEAFGSPERYQTPDGPLYRWRVTTGSGEIVRLTLDSPEFPSFAHILISDPRAAVPLNALTCRTEAEIRTVVEDLKRGMSA